MTTPTPESKSEYMRRMADGGLGTLASQAQVDTNIDASFNDIVIVVDDPGDLPTSTTIRPNGSFSDAASMHEYLETGGLVVTDNLLNAEPIGFVWALKEFDEILEQLIWTVYIDQDTG